MSSRKPVLLILLLVLLVMPVPALVAPGRITVYSTPSNANVCVDNTNCDSTTATFTVDGNAWHTVVITQPGYQQWSEAVYVTSAQTSVVNAVLETNPVVTGVQVFVNPGGGTVCIDNTQCRLNVGSPGSTSSSQFTGMDPGYHTLTVEDTPGYEDYSAQVFVTMGKVTTTTVDLVPAGVTVTPTPQVQIPMGAVRVYVDHLGSTICIDNRNCLEEVGGLAGPGTATTLFGSVTADSLHTVTVVADGYLPYSSQILVAKDQVTTVDVKLQPLQASTTSPTATVTETPVPPTPTFTPPTPIPPTKGSLVAVPLLGAIAIAVTVLLIRLSRK